MSRKLSAYLIIYNDWDTLEPALRSIAPFVDELVVVDGAYEWMAAYYRSLGQNPERSDDRVYDIINACGIPYRTIAQTWSSEVEKRTAGYESCSNRYAFRIDADEVVYFHPDRLEHFLDTGAVGSVEIPTYAAPGWVFTRKPEGWGKQIRLPRAGFMFDREQVSAEVHLNYLWLAGVDGDKKRPFAIYPHPLAFVAHLTQWRTAGNSARRHEFYVLNNMRRQGLPSWIPKLAGERITDFRQLFEAIDPAAFRDIIQVSRSSPKRMSAEECIVASPLSASDEAAFAGCYERRLHSIADLNSRISSAGMCFSDKLAIIVDISNADCARPVLSGSRVVFEFCAGVKGARAELYTIRTQSPWSTVEPLAHREDGNVVEVEIPSEDGAGGAVLRRQIELRAQIRSANPVERFKIIAPREPPGPKPH